VTMKMRYSESPEPPPPECAPSSADKIMHSSFKLGDSLVMASDGMATGKPEFKGVSLSISVRDDAEAKKVFTALSDGGQVQMPMGKTFFASAFGMVTDRFGVQWMVIADPEA
jgi:PhnB protein